MKKKKLLVYETRFKKSSVAEHEQLKEIFKNYLNTELTIDYIPVREMLKELKVNNGSVVQSSVPHTGEYDWVHVRFSSNEWKKLKLRSTLWGEHQKVNGVAITFGRWSEYTKLKRAPLFKKEFPEIKRLYEHVIGMLHEYGHSQEGSLAVVHSYLYGYDRLYTKAQERTLKPDRHVAPASLLKALEWIFNKNKVTKIMDVVVANITPANRPSLYKPKNFALKELVSKFIYYKFGDRAWQFFDYRILENLQYIRDFYGVPVTVNNWHKGGKFQYRGFDEGGFRKNGTSQHNHGRGIDYIIFGVSADQHRENMRSGKLKLPHPDVYVEDDVSWNHMDVRQSIHKGLYIFKP